MSWGRISRTRRSWPKSVVSEMEKALREHWYKEKVVQGNQLAWGEKKLEAVPSYCAGDRVLGSGDGFMVPRDDLDHFLKELDNR